MEVTLNLSADTSRLGLNTENQVKSLIFKKQKIMNYYNEWDSFAADWLKELIKDGLIPYGEVDSRSIADVEPSDLKGFTQCHFFAGIGGWSRALQLAGWSADRPVWTGSPPCQPFSTAGKQSGKEDLRHLWPVFFNLIRECQPATIFGEQVASAIRFGWLDDLQRDLEAEGYAAAAVVLPSGAVSAPHKRERLFFVAHSNNERYEWSSRDGWEEERRTKHSGSVSMANANGSGLEGQGEMGRPFCTEASENKEVNRAINDGRISSRISSCQEKSLGNSEHNGLHKAEIGRSTSPSKEEGGMLELERPNSLFWGSAEVIYCRDGKYRPIPTQPALFPLANGLPNRVGILRGAGNAIVPQAAAEIIKAYMRI
jgi:DNA (cytosine-5)-methyltransferase 1